jgi:hypothetical protein
LLSVDVAFDVEEGVLVLGVKEDCLYFFVGLSFLEDNNFHVFLIIINLLLHLHVMVWMVELFEELIQCVARDVPDQDDLAFFRTVVGQRVL